VDKKVNENSVNKNVKFNFAKEKLTSEGLYKDCCPMLAKPNACINV